MIQRYSVLACVVISVILLVVATVLYPGGSLLDRNSVGFGWSRNFISNLFAAKAMNGADNPGRIPAIIGMAFHALGYGIFFIRTAAKMPSRHASLVLRSIGAINIVFTALIATPLHDLMVTLSSTLFLVALFYITVFVLKAKLRVFSVACILCMLTFYYTLFLYGTGDWGLLAIMQKVSFISSMALVLAVEHYTGPEDLRTAAVPSPRDTAEV